jgi:N-acetylmuramoyl-L-alanine amidase
MLTIVDHTLRGRTSHHDRGVAWVGDNMGGELVPEMIVCHYTVSRSGPATARSLADETQRASVHLVVERDGDMIQQVPFDRIAWHAGKSSWNGSESCSRFSIGIEICNWGPLFPGGNGGWLNVYKKPVADTEAFHGRHQGPPGFAWEHWERYTDEQMITLAEVGRLLVATYPTITEIVGHDDIAPGRKRDPGPAFDMLGLRQAVFVDTEPAPPPTERNT